MATDGRDIPQDTVLEFDVCVIGAGAAGITIARDFSGEHMRVGLLESGGFHYEKEVQKLYRGQNTGRPYFRLDEARLRFFGGTTNHWEGWCRPLDPIDFDQRDWVAHSGWPLTREELLPYYRRAHKLCQLGPFDYNPENWFSSWDGDAILRNSLKKIAPTVFQYSPPTRFGVEYRDELEQADNVEILIHSTVTELVPKRGAEEIKIARIRTLAGNEFHVKADHFVLATGGIENARLLLASNSVRPAGLGNRHDLVGRFFMDHPHFVAAALLPARRKLRLPFFKRREVDGTTVEGVLTVPPEIQKREMLLNLSVQLRPPKQLANTYLGADDGWLAVRDVFADMKRGNPPSDLARHLKRILGDLDGTIEGAYQEVSGSDTTVFPLFCRTEQCPNPVSRVQLSRETDALGVPRADLHWTLSRQDLQSVRRGMELLAMEMGRIGVGRVKVPATVDQWGSRIEGGWHHMGTTRMAHDPRSGVVDPQCRVYGLENLFVAGSSVFPTSGFSNPTLTIVALALRLSTHLKRLS